MNMRVPAPAGANTGENNQPKVTMTAGASAAVSALLR